MSNEPKLSEARRMSFEEHEQGWFALACGCHAFVWRYEVAKTIPLGTYEYCDKCGLQGVKIEMLEKAHD